MPTLTELQKKQVIQREPTKSADYMLECIQKYDNLSLDDFPHMDDGKRKYIWDKLNSVPNPNEQKEWENIVALLDNPALLDNLSQEFLNSLNAYIKNWETSRPAENHVDEAKTEVPKIKNHVNEAKTEMSKVEQALEQKEWENIVALLDKLSQELLDSLNAYIKNWETSRPTENHVDEAKTEVSKVEQALKQKEWEKIVALLNNISQELLDSLNAYIKNWETSRPAENHVDEAKALLDNPSQELLNSLNAYIKNWETSRPAENHVNEANTVVSKVEQALEQKEWENIVALLDNPSQELLNSLNAYIKNWEISCPAENHVDEAKTEVPKVKNHVNDAKGILNAIVEWNGVKDTNDIFGISDYLRINPYSPFKQLASVLIAGLKQQEINAMRSNPANYDVSRLRKFLSEGVFTERELINANVVTENILKILVGEANVYDNLPNIAKAIEDSRAECNDGYTDVYFFGIPSTGKTCVLMGLSRADNLSIDTATGGGEYASALQEYTDVGATVPRTPGTFVTTLDAVITSPTNPNVSHKVNLVEMSGEEFAVQIAKNKKGIISFEDMGTGATKLLMNDNKKVFFLIIDPTVDVIHLDREIIDGYDEETGAPLVRMEYIAVNQRTIIQKMVDLFGKAENREIMKNVDSIHIIMTKADTLGNVVEREDKAYKLFQVKYSHDILKPKFLDLCLDCNINANSEFYPKLYTFSLGDFYVGGFYEYNSADSNKLVTAIMNATRSSKKKSFWDKIKDLVN